MSSNKTEYQRYIDTCDEIVKWFKDSPKKKYFTKDVAVEFGLSIDYTRKALLDLTMKGVLKRSESQLPQYYYPPRQETSTGSARSPRMDANPWVPPLAMTERLDMNRVSSLGMSSKIPEFSEERRK